MPITDKAYNKVKQGKLKDYELSIDDIVAYSSHKPLKCLFTSIVIHPKFQTGLALTRLWKGFINKLKSLNLTITSVIMDCVTEMGEKCAKNYLGAQFITNSNNGRIYEGNINLVENQVDSPCVVLDIEPVTHILTLAIYG